MVSVLSALRYTVYGGDVSRRDEGGPVKITFVTVNFEDSARTKRVLLRVGLPAALLLAIGGVAYASLPHTFVSGESLTAANLNANFDNLDTRVTALEGLDKETSGSRLTARYTTTTQTGADGAARVNKTFAGWFDTQRNEYCFPGPASDGQERCLPSDSGGPGGVGAVGVGNRLYSDAACLKPLIAVQLDSGCTQMPTCSTCNPPPPKYFRAVYSTCSAGTGSTSPGTHLYPVGSQLSLTTVYTGQPGSCQPQTAPSNTLWYDASSTAEIAPTSFVAFTVTSQTQ
jgi:hypothetical protein